MNDFTTTITVQQSPAQVFAAITDVRAWWSDQIEGRTDELGAEFTYRFKKAHRTVQKITELVPDEKVVWHVTDSYINFADEQEWTGTDIVFEIARKGGETELRFTHVGLVPECGCYDACRKGWTFYITASLRDLIARGKGQPARGADQTDASFTRTFVVDRTPAQVFDAITDARRWWPGDIEGRTGELGATFVLRYKDLHHSTHRITELARGRRVVWHTEDAELGSVEKPAEWRGTDIVFELEEHGGATRVRFTHAGLVPALACYAECSRGWTSLLDGLASSIASGKAA